MRFLCNFASHHRKTSCSRVNRSRTIALGVARQQNGLAPLQNAFTALQNGLAPLQNAFAASFHVLAVVRGAIARLFRRLFWWLWSSVASSSSQAYHTSSAFRAEGCRACRGNAKFARRVRRPCLLTEPGRSLTSPMILHLLAAPTSLHLGIAHASMALHSTFGTPVEK